MFFNNQQYFIMSKYREQAQDVYDFIEILSNENPEVAKNFGSLHKSALEGKALSGKHKELISLGISITIRCEGCIAVHVLSALKEGATKEEIIETIGVAIVMGGGPSLVYGEKAYKALKEMI